MKYKTAMVLGKFLPPHLGHGYLIDTARFASERLCVVVGTLAREPIPGALRAQWVQELFPDVEVVHLDQDLPQDPSEHPDFWTLWRTALNNVLPFRPKAVFASEHYGTPLAKELESVFVPVDIARTHVPISGTNVRRAPWQHWSYLPVNVRPFFLHKICLVGPESTGKTTLARELAQHYQTGYVPEYAADIVAQKNGFFENDVSWIMTRQQAGEQAMARTCQYRMFSDSDALTTKIWSEHMFGHAPKALVEAVEQQTYDMTFLMAPDTPYIDDLHRLCPDQSVRNWFFERFQTELLRLGRPYCILQGSWEQRKMQALSTINAMAAPQYP